MVNSIASRTPFPPATLGVAVAIFAVGGFGPNSPLAALAVAVLLLGAFLLWRPGESPILLFVFCFQWLQASIEVFHANWMGIDIVDFTTEGGHLGLAIVLSLLGLLALAFGMRLGAGPWRAQDSARARITSSRFGPSYWFRLYAVAFVAATIAQNLSVQFPGLSQPLLALGSLKWAFYWMLAYATFAEASTGSTLTGNSRFYALFALGVETMLGLGGYFSDFKTPLFFTLLAAMTAGVRLTLGRYLGLLSLAAVALTLALAWSGVKVEYRDYVSGGQKAQVVTVGYVERIGMLAHMVSQLDRDAVVDASDKLLRRLAYVEYFGVVLNTVPQVLPHEGGSIWWDAISRPFMPRLFFPDKTIIDDTQRTIQFTGLNPETVGEGTSISIGYMAESYIDFGAIGMMVPIFGLGLLLGRFYRSMLRLDPTRLLGMALATATIYGAAFLDSSITKIFGGLVVTMLVSWAVMRIARQGYLPRVQQHKVVR